MIDPQRAAGPHRSAARIAASALLGLAVLGLAVLGLAVLGLAVLGLAVLGLAVLGPALALAGPVEVVKAVFERSGAEWDVAVTLRHADTGWEHYANVWVVESLEGQELGRRVLFHPHEDEQPFTRSERIRIPAGITRVQVRAGDNRSGIDSNTVVVDLTRAEGERYEVR